MSLNRRSYFPTCVKILRYLESNPQAMDSEKGIASWWVQDKPKNIQSALVQLQALDILHTKEINGERYYFLKEVLRNRAVIRDLILSASGKKGTGLKKSREPKPARIT